MARENFLPLEVWRRKGVERGRLVVTRVCHTPWIESHRALAGCVLEGLVQEPFRGLDRDSEWSTGTWRVERRSVNKEAPYQAMKPLSSYETFHKFISYRTPRGSSELNQISVNTSQHSPKNHGETPSAWNWEDLSPFLWHYLKRRQGVQKNLNNNSKR